MTEFLSQLAQFSSFDGLSPIHNTLQELVSSLQSNQALQASALVGRKVLVFSGHFALGTKMAPGIAVEVAEGISDINAYIYSELGALIKTMPLQPGCIGLYHFIWDGTDDQHQRVAAGKYKVQVKAKQAGSELTLKTMILANVNSVSLGGNGESLKLNVSGIGPVLLHQVRQISV